jgi:hypothetical protein
MEKKLFIVSGVFLVIAITSGVLYFTSHKPEMKTPVNFSDPTTLDSDGDGLDNAEETQLGTDEKKVDTDGDGLTDYQEVRTFKTNPLSQDTDKDGYGDKEEIATKHDPLQAGK